MHHQFLQSFMFWMHRHPHCRNCCQLHQQSNQEETSETFSTWETDQQLQVPVWQMSAIKLWTCNSIILLCLLCCTEKSYTHCTLKGLAQQIYRWTGKTGQIYTCVLHVIKLLAGDQCPYPSGSFFFQLANTASACVIIGGSPKRCDTSQYGTARFCGSI